jgi:hypothetical protein
MGLAETKCCSLNFGGSGLSGAAFSFVGNSTGLLLNPNSIKAFLSFISKTID